MRICQRVIFSYILLRYSVYNAIFSSHTILTRVFWQIFIASVCFYGCLFFISFQSKQLSNFSSSSLYDLTRMIWCSKNAGSVKPYGASFWDKNFTLMLCIWDEKLKPKNLVIIFDDIYVLASLEAALDHAVTSLLWRYEVVYNYIHIQMPIHFVVFIHIVVIKQRVFQRFLDCPLRLWKSLTPRSVTS